MALLRPLYHGGGWIFELNRELEMTEYVRRLFVWLCCGCSDPHVYGRICRGLFVIMLGGLSVGCSISGYEERYRVGDREVEDIIEESSYSNRLEKRNKLSARSTGKFTGFTDEPSGEEQQKSLTLEESFQIALKNNRELLNEIEDSALSYIDAKVEQHRYQPIIQPVTLSLTRTGSQFADRKDREEEASFRVEQRLPFGGAVETGVRLRNRHGNQVRGSSVRPFLSLNIPLLRGGGMIAEQNDLVNAVRARRYAKRELRDFKQKFFIEILEQYFSILREKRTIENFRSQLNSAQTLLDQSNIQFNTGNISKVDLFRAEFQKTEANRDLQIEQERLKLTKDAFKIDLGLSLSTTLQLADHKIQFEKKALSPEKYIQKVLDNNLLWKNQLDQYQDARRRLKVAYNDTLPELDLEADVNRTRSGDSSFRDLNLQDTDWSMGFSLELPIDRTFLDQDLHEAIVNFRKAERDLSLARDQLIQETREKIIQIRQARFNIEARKQAIKQARKALELLEHQYEQGKVTNRDVIEEQNNLIRSKNRLLRALVNWKVRRLELQQKAGELSVDQFEDWMRHIQ